MLSMLSSSRPEVSPRLSRRSTSLSSGQTRKRTMLERQTCLERVSFLSHPRPGPTETHALVKLDGLVHLPREPINQERLDVALLALGDDVEHGVLEQLERDLHRDNLALLDVVLDQRAVLALWPLLLRAEEVARCSRDRSVTIERNGRRGGHAPERCAKWRSDTRRAHCVPLPALER